MSSTITKYEANFFSYSYLPSNSLQRQCFAVSEGDVLSFNMVFILVTLISFEMTLCKMWFIYSILRRLTSRNANMEVLGCLTFILTTSFEQPFSIVDNRIRSCKRYFFLTLLSDHQDSTKHRLSLTIDTHTHTLTMQSLNECLTLNYFICLRNSQFFNMGQYLHKPTLYVHAYIFQGHVHPLLHQKTTLCKCSRPQFNKKYINIISSPHIPI